MVPIPPIKWTRNSYWFVGDEWIGIWFVKGCFHGLFHLLINGVYWGYKLYMLYNPLILTFYWWLMLGMMVKISSWKKCLRKMVRRLKTWNGPFSGEHLNFPGGKWIQIAFGSNSFPLLHLGAAGFVGKASPQFHPGEPSTRKPPKLREVFWRLEKKNTKLTPNCRDSRRKGIANLRNCTWWDTLQELEKGWHVAAGHI